MKYISIIVIVFFAISCEQRKDVDRRMANINISTPSNYKMLDFKSDWAIGESTEDYTMIISENDYRKIISEIQHKKNFQRLDTNSTPIYALDANTDKSKMNEIAYWYDNKYLYEIFIPKPASVTTVVLEKDSLMSILYRDL